MQPYPEAIPSIHLHTNPSPKCAHVYLRQSTYPSLPPLYIAAKLRSPRTSSLPLQRIAYLQCSYEFLGSMKPRLPYIGRDVDALRKELEGGMSRDRRKRMRRFVKRLQDKRQRRAAELYLARILASCLMWRGSWTMVLVLGWLLRRMSQRFGEDVVL